VKLVQMPTDLLHLEDADLDRAGLDPGLLAAFRAYLGRALDERRGLAILLPTDANACHLLMVLARRIGVALRDANIRLRDDGGDLKAERQKLCYLPGAALASALGQPGVRGELAREAACFVQDLDTAWGARQASPAAGLAPGPANAAPLEPSAVLALLDERLAAGRPTFLNAAPDRLPPGLADDLRARLPILTPPS
jgi:hypothetical protein